MAQKKEEIENFLEVIDGLDSTLEIIEFRRSLNVVLSSNNYTKFERVLVMDKLKEKFKELRLQ